MKKRSDFENDRRGAGSPDSRRREPGRREDENRRGEDARAYRGRPQEDPRDRDDRPYGRRSRGENRSGPDSQQKESRGFGKPEDWKKSGERPFPREYDREKSGSKDREREARPFQRRYSEDKGPDRGFSGERKRSSSRDERETGRRGRDDEARYSEDKGADKRFSGERRRSGFRDERESGRRSRDHEGRRPEDKGPDKSFPGEKRPYSRRFDKDENPDRASDFRPREGRFQRHSPGNDERFTGPGPARGRREEKEDSFRRTSGRMQRPDYDASDAGRKNTKSAAPGQDDRIRLNRFIANAGICSRREADELIEAGQITVNGKVVNEMGFKVGPADVVKYGKRILNAEKLVYILLNKPKDYITTTDDPEDRRTVLHLIEGACEERVYPVGRLDRNTTGLLLITNDGELADKLTHPSHNIKKVYQAELDKPITLEDFETLKNGVELEDGFVKPDDIGIVTPDAFVVGIEIHSGRNRIVRRMFEHLGYEVKKLDRTTFAGLNKKDLPRGNWRFLTQKEVITLKFLV